MILQLFLIAGIWGCSTYGLTVEEFREKIEPKCYDFKDDKELINGQVSPLPSSLETFVNIVEGLEDKNYGMERILRSFLASFRCDDLEYTPPHDMEPGGFVTRGSEDVGKAHQILLELLGGNINDDIKFSDISEDERCALYFMISHTVNDTKLDRISEEETLRHPREQGVVNLNTKTRHSIALGKVLLGIFAGLRGSDQEVSAVEILNRMGRKVNGAIDNFNVNVLYGVTTSDIFTLTWNWKKNPRNTYCKSELLLPNGYWDDSVCPTKYILDDVGENQCYATNALFRGAVDGLILGLKIKDLQSSYTNIRLSQVLRMYYGLGTPSSDTFLSELSWCNRHSLFTSYQLDIIKNAYQYSKLYAAALSNPLPVQEQAMTDIMNGISTLKSKIFDEVYDEGECSKTVSSSSKICETPRDVAAVLDYKSVNKENQYQIIGNLSVGFHMGLGGGSSMAVYTNLKPLGGGFELHSINISKISGCASCAAKYFDYFDQPTTSTESEVEVFRDLNRTLVSDDLLGDDENEPGAPAKMVLYFNYGNPGNTQELKNVIWEFRKNHKGTKVFAIGTKKDVLTPFVQNVDNDIILQNDARALANLNEKICKVPAQFQFKNCYKNSRSDEDANAFQGYITPYHVQYWAMHPKYFLKSFSIKMTFSARQGKVQVCYTRNYDDIISNRLTQMNCQNAESDKTADFYVKDPCKKYDVYNCRPFIFRIEALNTPAEKCQDKMCVTPNQIQFEFKHTGISCNKGISFASSPMTLIIVMFISMFYVFKK